MKSLVTLIIFFLPFFAFGQFKVGYNQSNLPFIGVSYEIKEKFRPELRIGTDTYFEYISLEGIVSYDIVNKEDYEFYGGLGFNESLFQWGGLVIPIGFNFYPLTNKCFGFQIELAPIFGESNFLRGSLGIGYKFRSTQAEKL
jgi:hypothetical protein